MLVIGRKHDEALIISEAIGMTVVALTGEQVRLDIQARAAVSLLRPEVLERWRTVEREVTIR